MATEQRAAQKSEWRPRRTASELSSQFAFDIPREAIPDGMVWEWKRYSMLGELDPSHQVRMRRDGAWDVVTHEQWPERLGEFGKKGEPIIVDGMILMQRPAVYSEEAVKEQLAVATEGVKNHLKQLGLSDGPVPKAKPSVKREWEKVSGLPVPD